MGFQINDKVKVLKVINEEDLNGKCVETFVGQTGIILRIDNTWDYPYTVLFDSEDVANTGIVLWAEEEIEKVVEN